MFPDRIDPATGVLYQRRSSDYDFRDIHTVKMVLSVSVSPDRNLERRHETLIVDLQDIEEDLLIDTNVRRVSSTTDPCSTDSNIWHVKNEFLSITVPCSTQTAVAGLRHLYPMARGSNNVLEVSQLSATCSTRATCIHEPIYTL